MNRDISQIPKHLLSSLERYAKHGVTTGSFLRACIANDLQNAACRADEEAFNSLPAITMFIHYEMSHLAHGSYELYELWVAAHDETKTEDEVSAIKQLQDAAYDKYRETRSKAWQ